MSLNLIRWYGGRTASGPDSDYYLPPSVHLEIGSPNIYTFDCCTLTSRPMWTCICGKENAEDTPICSTCNSERFGLPVWWQTLNLLKVAQLVEWCFRYFYHQIGLEIEEPIELPVASHEIFQDATGAFYYVFADNSIVHAKLYLLSKLCTTIVTRRHSFWPAAYAT